jgi:5'-methylthioadenosine phosphorylase
MGMTAGLSGQIPGIQVAGGSRIADRVSLMDDAHIGIIGGSGLYQIDGLTGLEELDVDTPFGKPSDLITGGTLGGRRVFFLPRHGRGHRLLPTELNHRANIYALRSLGVRFIISVSAVGSLQEKFRPRDIVLPDQFFDRTSRREHHTFFGGGVVAHIAFADPVSGRLRELLHRTCVEQGRRVHNGGTYVNMDGPAFSTRAESLLNRRSGFDVVGMTNLPEAKLAREAEIALATLAMVTDYDCWKTDEEPVNARTVIEHLVANAAAAREILAGTIPLIPPRAAWPEHQSLDSAMITDRALWPAETRCRLQAILGRFGAAAG